MMSPGDTSEVSTTGVVVPPDAPPIVPLTTASLAIRPTLAAFSRFSMALTTAATSVGDPADSMSAILPMT